jgi:hypothetical protein
MYQLSWGELFMSDLLMLCMAEYPLFVAQHLLFVP